MHKTILLVLATASAALSQTTVPIGGPGTKGLQQGNPPELSDASLATGEITYAWDGVDQLTVTVANTTAQVAGEENPVITDVYFNVPNGTVSAMTLVSQVDAQSNPTNFGFSFDDDVLNSPSPNLVGAWGSFNVCLQQPSGPVAGIINPSATSWIVPAGPRRIEGPVVFTFQVTAQNPGLLSDADFAAAMSGSNDPVTAALKFQAGGVGGIGSGFIGTRRGCVPGLVLRGDPCVDPAGPNTIEFVMSNAPGCHNCLVLAYNDTPFNIGGVVFPASPPYEVYWSADAMSPYTVLPVTLPPTLLSGITVTFANLSWDRSPFQIRISDTLTFTLGVCAP